MTNDHRPATNNEDQKKSSKWNNLQGIINIILTCAIVYFGYAVYNLNNNIAKRDKSILEGKQYAIVREIRQFLTEYITEFVCYLAYEHHKVLTTNFRNIASTGTNVETPTISRKYYVGYPSPPQCLECSRFANILAPELQDDVEKYFAKNPTLKPLQSDILDSEQTELYFNLKNSVDELNKRFNKSSQRHKKGEEYWIKMALDNKIEFKEGKLKWNTVTIYSRNMLVNLIEDVRNHGDLFLKSFSQLNTKILKFILEIESNKPFRKGDERFSLSHNPSPIKEATIYSDENTYKFDYYKYFVISTKKEFEEYEMNSQALEDKTIQTTETYYRFINE